MRFTVKNFLLGTALTIGLLGTGAAANAQAREFHGGGGRAEAGGHFDGRGYGGGYVRPEVRGYGYRGGYGVEVGAPYVGGYVDPYAYAAPYPGDGYVWLNGGWVFRGRPGFVGGYGRGYDRGFDHGFDRGGRGFDRGGGRGFEGGGRGFGRR